MMESPDLLDSDANSETEFEVVIIGSGFGGSIAAIEFGKVLKKWNADHGDKKKVCILERGTWYMTPEAWLDSKNKVAAFVRKDDRPYSFWPMPDNRGGMLNLITKLRVLPSGKGTVNGLLDPIVDPLAKFGVALAGKRTNPNGLYDVKNFRETFVLTSNGVGGGSLVYSNVTISPEPEILDEIFYEKDRGTKVSNPEAIWKPKWKITFDMLDPYMMYAKHNFIEVSKIYTVQASIYGEQMMLPKTRELRNAVKDMKQSKYYASFELTDLSITEAPVWDGQKREYQKGTTNFCRRQGRCNLGCLPGARHSLNKKIVDAKQGSDGKEGLPIVIRELTEVTAIQPKNKGADGYLVHYLDLRRNKEGVLHARMLVLAAGTYGTTGLILRSREKPEGSPHNETFSEVSEKVGTRLSVNGDTFGFAIDTKNPVYITRGPIDTADVRFKKWVEYKSEYQHHFTIEDATIPRMAADVFSAAIEMYIREIKGGPKEGLRRRVTFFFWHLMPVVSVGLELLARGSRGFRAYAKAIMEYFGRKKWGPRYGSHSWFIRTKEAIDKEQENERRKREADELEQDYVEEELEQDFFLSRVFFFACMGIDRANGRAEWNSRKKELEINWNGLADDPIFKEIRDGMEAVGSKMIRPEAGVHKVKGRDYRLVLEPLEELYGYKKKMFCLHPLGGCPMDTDFGDQIECRGAVNSEGRLRMKEVEKFYQNLYIVDGSVVPTALGVNPSLTIAGLAFRIIDRATDKMEIDGQKPVGPFLHFVKNGEEKTVTLRENITRSGNNFTVATVSPDDDGTKYDNIIYVGGHHLRDDYGLNAPQPRRAKVKVTGDVVDRVAYATLKELL